MCIVTECSTVGVMDYNFHHFLRDTAVRSLWVKAVHNQRKNCKGPTDASLICLIAMNKTIVKNLVFHPGGGGRYSNYFPQA